MRTLSVFNFLTLNGFYKGQAEDISWHSHGGEEGEFANQGAQSDGVLLFGRVTYEMMYSFWPTPEAMQQFPLVAEGMNRSEKIVFSNTLQKADWNNTRVVGGDIVEEVRRLKSIPGKPMVILGSGSIVMQLADAGLIDEFQFMVDPVVLGEGTTLFQGLGKKLDLVLTSSKIFKSGVLLLNYKPL